MDIDKLAAQVWGITKKELSVGIIGGHCVTEVRLNFYAVLTPANIVTSDERLKSTLNKLERIPLTYYQDGQIGRTATGPAFGRWGVHDVTRGCAQDDREPCGKLEGKKRVMV